jgi:hypothetical protein
MDSLITHDSTTHAHMMVASTVGWVRGSAHVRTYVGVVGGCAWCVPVSLWWWAGAGQGVVGGGRGRQGGWVHGVGWAPCPGVGVVWVPGWGGVWQGGGG